MELLSGYFSVDSYWRRADHMIGYLYSCCSFSTHSQLRIPHMLSFRSCTRLSYLPYPPAQRPSYYSWLGNK